MGEGKIRRRLCYLLDKCDECERKTPYRNTWGTKERNKMCLGCQYHEEIEQIRPTIDSGLTGKYKRILAKGQDMTTDEIKYLIREGVMKTDIRKALKMNSKSFSVLQSDLGIEVEKRKRKKVVV